MVGWERWNSRSIKAKFLSQNFKGAISNRNQVEGGSSSFGSPEITVFQLKSASSLPSHL